MDEQGEEIDLAKNVKLTKKENNSNLYKLFLYINNVFGYLWQLLSDDASPSERRESGKKPLATPRDGSLLDAIVLIVSLRAMPKHFRIRKTEANAAP